MEVGHKLNSIGSRRLETVVGPTGVCERVGEDGETFMVRLTLEGPREEGQIDPHRFFGTKI